MDGLRNFFLRRRVKAKAEEYGFTFEQAKRALEKVAAEKPGETIIIVFSQKNNEPPTLLVEDRETHLQRLHRQVVKTGIFSTSPL